MVLGQIKRGLNLQLILRGPMSLIYTQKSSPIKMSRLKGIFWGLGGLGDVVWVFD